ncbi:protein kinase [Streptomyces sp. P9(2023)]|uniref:protein kinase domain-containing protein n=1 Tax=Streptomyces sp. P9(2023) TaxID=3064394 RepID=UPI0028F3F0F9|nr:protein kinase [Streptomyces sp. P9(2023)]MDT9687357.1 protein kinase [Streptomyces sp. P9(2023)]
MDVTGGGAGGSAGGADRASGLWRVGDVVDGRYEVLRVHEQGGMGLVHRVRHLEWGTDLAVKSPRPELLATDGFLDRFVAEAETWVSLGLHPHVCGCHYVRSLDGTPRVFAEYVAGGSLAEWIRDGRLYAGGEAAARARIVDFAIQMAWGLEHAHSRGLVHQDVKPGNALVDEDGTVKVTDFGLARAAGAGSPGAPVGTELPGGTVLVTRGGLSLPYASPEQVAGGRLGRRTDLYSFAVSVLEMFTGGVTWMAGPVAGAALESYLADGGADAGGGDAGDGRLPAMPDGLGGLLARCLRADPARRPASAAEFAEELAELYGQMTGTPYDRPVPEAADLRADELNNRALSLLDLGRGQEAERAFDAALAADPRHLRATYNKGLHEWRGGVITDDEFVTVLETLRGDTDTDPGQARLMLAQVHLERGDRDSARSLLEETDRDGPAPREAEPIRQALRSGRAADARLTLTGPLPWRDHSTLWRDLSRLSGDGNVAVTGGRDGRIRLWDLRSGDCRLTLEGHDKEVVALDIDATGRNAVSADADGVLRFWDLAEGRSLGVRVPRVSPRLARVDDLRLSGDGRIVVALVNGTLGAWDFPTGPWHKGLGRALGTGPDVLFTHLEVSADGSRVLTRSGDGEDTTTGTWAVWDLRTARRLWSVPPAQHVQAISLSADGRYVALATNAGANRHRIQRRHVDSGREEGEMTGPHWRVTTLALSPDGRLALAANGDDDGVRLWDLAEGRCLRTFRGHPDGVRRVLFGADARSAVSVDRNEARWWAWDLPGAFPATPLLSVPRRHGDLDRNGRQAATLLAAAREAMAAGRHPEALELLERARAVPGHERTPDVLDAWRELGAATVRVGLRGVTALRTLRGALSHVSVAISADGRRVACGGRGYVGLWDATNGKQHKEWESEGGASVALSADGRRVMASGDARITMWTAPHGHWPVRLDTRKPGGRWGPPGIGASGDRGAVSFGADGRLALGACGDNALRMWDLADGRCVRTLTGHRTWCNEVWLSPDARRAVSGGSDGEVRVWDVEAGTSLTIPHEGTWIDSVCLAADGRQVLCAGDHQGHTLWLLDAATGQFVRGFDDVTEPSAGDGEEDPDRSGQVLMARLTSDGRFAVSAERAGAVRIWETATGRCLRTLDAHTDDVEGIALTPDDRFLVTGSTDGTMRLWELDWQLGGG